MIFRRTIVFKRELRSLPPEIQRIAHAKYRLFRHNWRHPSLNVHKLEGVTWHGHQVFDLYLTNRYRVLFVIDHDGLFASLSLHAGRGSFPPDP